MSRETQIAPGVAVSEIGSNRQTQMIATVSISETFAPPTMAVTGTIVASILEADIVTGSKQAILTLTGKSWVPA